MKVIYTRIADGVKHIQVEEHYVICIDILLKSPVSKNFIQKYPVDYYIYPAFDLHTTLPTQKVDPLQYGTFYVPVTHNFTIRELVNHITRYNALFSSFSSLY